MTLGFKDKHFVSFLVILVCISIFIFKNFPTPGQYYATADEGMYFKRSMIINEMGLKGFSKITDNFIFIEQEHNASNPCRYLYYMCGALFVGLSPKIDSLSILSLFYFFVTGLILYIYIKKLENEKIAFFTSILAITFPISMGMAGRALMDSGNTLFCIWVLLSYALAVKEPIRNNWAVFAMVSFISFFYKESNFFVVPFFALFSFYLIYTKKNPLSYRSFFYFHILPPLIAIAGYIAFVGGFEKINQVIHIMQTTRIEYVFYWGNGPWYQYLIEFSILSLATMILFFSGIFDFKKHPNQKNILLLFLTFFIFSLIVYAFIPKNIRFFYNCFIVCSLFASHKLLSIKISSKNKIQNIFPYIFVTIVGISHCLIYYNLFKINNMYDPTFYEIIKDFNFIPA